ncbi:hypothetical protein HYU11_01770 [Candidatus Woesearchaeota archaeon]|nr:hypothetical protein [Candidatus Woesearchaeota archaeon]
MSKRGYFFTLDAFVAMGIIVVGLFIVLGSYSYTPLGDLPEIMSGDILVSLSSTKVSEINSNYVRALIDNGTITNTENSVLQQLGEFYVNNQVSMGSRFMSNISSNIIPRQYGVSVSIDNFQVFNEGPKLLPGSRTVVSSKSLVFGIYNGSMWGPFPAEVSMWQ